MLNELESQNDGEVEGIMGKVKMLKNVSFYPFVICLGGGKGIESQQSRMLILHPPR